MRHPGITIIILFVLFNINLSGQPDRKNYFPVWTFHDDSVNIHGISVGFLSSYNYPTYTNTNGIKLELIGVGLFASAITYTKDTAYIRIQQQPLFERINGLNLSTFGTSCHCLTNGITAGFFGQANSGVNGISISCFKNFTQKHNGIMTTFYYNEAYQIRGLQIAGENYGYEARGVQIGIENITKEMYGLQIGIYNVSEQFKGIQIGIWNKNQNRQLPLINWNFERKKTRQAGMAGMLKNSHRL